MAYTFEKDPFGTIGEAVEGLTDFAIHPIDGLQEVGMQIAELKSKGDLDTLLNDDVSAAQHYGEAASITASVLMPGAVEGKQALKKGLNNAVDDALNIDAKYVTGQGEGGQIIDADPWNVGGTDKDIYVNSDDTLIYPTTGYRVLTESGFESANNGGSVMSSSGTTYFTFDNPGDFSSNVEAGNAVQVPYDPAGYVKFDTIQLGDDIQVPKENWNTGTNPEPFAVYFGPSNHDKLNYGKGQATQAITNTEIKNYEVKEFSNEGN